MVLSLCSLIICDSFNAMTTPLTFHDLRRVSDVLIPYATEEHLLAVDDCALLQVVDMIAAIHGIDLEELILTYDLTTVPKNAGKQNLAYYIGRVIHVITDKLPDRQEGPLESAISGDLSALPSLLSRALTSLEWQSYQEAEFYDKVVLAALNGFISTVLDNETVEAELSWLYER